MSGSDSAVELELGSRKSSTSPVGDGDKKKKSGLARSEGDIEVSKLELRLETDRKMIAVGLAKALPVERRFLGVSLSELSLRDSRQVPVLLSDCVKWLWQNRIERCSSFLTECAVDRVHGLIQRMEKGLYVSMFDETDINASLLGGVIRELFQNLPEPLITRELAPLFVDHSTDYAVLLKRLPESHLAAVRSLFPLLNELATAKIFTATQLAEHFGPGMMHSCDAAAAIKVVEELIVHWTELIADVTVRLRVSAEVQEKPFVLEEALQELGIGHFAEIFQQLGISSESVRTLTPGDLMQIGLAPQEASKLAAMVAGHPAAEEKPTDDQAWDGQGLDPKVQRFLEGLQLGHLLDLFEKHQVDWTILDMSAACDLSDMGLDHFTVEKILRGLGKSASRASLNGGGNGGDASGAGGGKSADTVLDPKWIVDLRQIRVQKKIGIGGYAEVWKALFKDKVVAFKLLQEETTEDQRVVEEFRREMVVMSSLDHPNIVAFYGAVDHGKSLAMVLEFAGRGDLEGILLDREVPIPYVQRLRWAKQVAQGLQYLHTRNPRIIHRDIKSANILVDELLCTKICDFGLAKRTTVSEIQSETGSGISVHSRVMNVRSAAVQFTTLVGTPAWTAPELIANRAYTEKVDIYSYGVFLWELMCRQTPHEGMPHFELAYAILAHNLRPQIPSWMPETYAQLMQSCWSSKSEFRPHIDVVLKIITTMLSLPKHDEIKLPF